MELPKSFQPFGGSNVAAAAGLRADEVIGAPGDDGIITVRPSTGIVSRQRLGQFVGISGANSGARGLSRNRVVIPPGGSATAVAIVARNDPDEQEHVELIDAVTPAHAP